MFIGKSLLSEGAIEGEKVLYRLVTTPAKPPVTYLMSSFARRKPPRLAEKTSEASFGSIFSTWPRGDKRSPDYPPLPSVNVQNTLIGYTWFYEMPETILPPPIVNAP